MGFAKISNFTVIGSENQQWLNQFSLIEDPIQPAGSCVFTYVQIYRNLRRNPKSAFENFFSSTPSGPSFSHCL